MKTPSQYQSLFRPLDVSDADALSIGLRSTDSFDESDSLATNHLTIEQLHAWLSARMLQLLNHDLNRLMALLYRADVSESVFQAAMHEGTASDIANALAWAFIHREHQRLQTRRSYTPPPPEADNIF
jgi:hypothetical protein